MLGIFAEFETNLRRERQMDGLAKAKAKAKAKVASVYKGGRTRIQADEVRRLAQEGVVASAIAWQLGIGRVGVYRMLGINKTVVV